MSVKQANEAVLQAAGTIHIRIQDEFFRPIYDLETRGSSYMRGANIVEMNYQQPVNSGLTLWGRLICKVVLYARIYGNELF